MSIRIVRLGSRRAANEGLRIGTVRRPPRGVAKKDFSRLDYYDVWLPELSPSAALVGFAQKATTAAQWAQFAKRYRREMDAPEARRLLDLLVALSRTTNFSAGCYCEDESHCHRSVLRAILRERGAEVR